MSERKQNADKCQSLTRFKTKSRSYRRTKSICYLRAESKHFNCISHLPGRNKYGVNPDLICPPIPHNKDNKLLKIIRNIPSMSHA